MLYQLKAIRKNSKPPIWRRILVPSDITFSQMALVLETLLEIPCTKNYEFEFHTKGDRMHETEDVRNYRSSWMYRNIVAPDNYVNDWLEKEKWFTFRTISGNDKWTAKGEYLLLEYRVDIEKLVDSAELCSDGNTSVPVSYPVIIKERTYSDDELWNRSREFMISVGEPLKYKYTERKNTDFDTALSDMKDERVLSRQAHPVNNSEKTHESIRTIMKKYSEVLDSVKVSLDMLENNADDFSDEEFCDIINKSGALLDNIGSGLEKTRFLSYRNPLENHTDGSRRFRKLDEYLGSCTIDEIKTVADNSDIIIKEKSKKTMAFEIARYLLEPAHMRDIMLDVSEEELDAFEKLIGRGCSRISQDEAKLYEELFSRGYVSLYTDDTAEVCEDVELIYNIICRNGYRKKHKQYDWIRKCTYYFTNFHAVAPVRILYKICRRKPELAGTFEEFSGCFNDMPDRLKYCRIIDGLAINESLVKGNEYKDAMEKQLDVEYYIPSVSEIDEYYRYGYPASERSYIRLCSYLRESLGVKDEDVDPICYEICIIVSWKHPFRMIFDVLRDYGIEAGKKEQRELSEYIDAVRNVTRTLYLRGHMHGEAMNIIAEATPDNPRIHSVFVDELPFEYGYMEKQKPVVNEKKIYPNDPCPCGSGKKYKKCCGRYQ